MVIVFGAGFAFLGVGSGGLDLGQMIQDAFGTGGSSGTSISSAQKDVAKHPRQAHGYKVLADAYERKGRRADAIGALQQYAALKPKDTGQLERLANLQAATARAALQEAQQAFYDQQTATAGEAFGAAPTSKFAQALADPITAAVSAKVQQRAQIANAKYQSTSSAAIATLKRVAKIRPDQTSYFQLARTAEEFGDTSAAVGAYKKLLKVIKDPATKRSIRAKVAQLQPQAPKGGG
jgi:tetratricopeptide (TPR) repeat protein